MRWLASEFLMNDIDILKKAIAKKHPCDDCHAALNRLESLLSEATIFFAPDADFDGKKTDWLSRAGLLTKKAANVQSEPRRYEHQKS